MSPTLLALAFVKAAAITADGKPTFDPDLQQSIDDSAVASGTLGGLAGVGAGGLVGAGAGTLAQLLR